MRTSPLLSLMLLGAVSLPMPTVSDEGVYDAASRCASDILAAYPSLMSEWLPSDGAFGGRESASYVGQVPHGRSSMPDINMMDGPQGVRDILSGKVLENRTSWPAASSVGMTWSPALAYHAGLLGARDWRTVGANVALTPGVNVHRLPIGGRNWEYVSGEDAALGVLGGWLSRGLQSEGMMATLKHYAVNNQELKRESTVARIDEATLMGTYLRAFQPTVDAGVGAVMCSYNRLQLDSQPQGSYSYTCASEPLSTRLLRQTMGFKGALMTDWNAAMTATEGGADTLQRSVVDWEMRWGSDITAKLPTNSHNSTAHHVLTGMLASGILQNTSVPSCQKPGVKVPTKTPPTAQLPPQYLSFQDVGQFAATLISESMVLLKNSGGALPLRQGKRVLLTGSYLLNGGGSGDSAAFGWFAPEHNGEGLHNGGSMGQQQMREKLSKATGCDVHWDFEGGNAALDTYDVVVAFGGQFRSEAYLVQDTDGFYDIDQCDSRTNSSTYGECEFSGTFLQGLQNSRSSGTKVIAVTTTGGVHFPDYMELVDAALTLMYPGQHFAAALADVLAGAVSPGGKLTYTLPNLEQDGAHVQSPVGRFNAGLQYPPPARPLTSQSPGGGRLTLLPPAMLWNASSNSSSHVVQYGETMSTYAEENLVGYKYYEKFKMQPMFAFGWGLSYARWAVKASFARCRSTCSCTVDLSAQRSGAFSGIASTVLQVYVGFESDMVESQQQQDLRAVKELRGFLKVWANGQYSIDVDSAAFKPDWDAASASWRSPCEEQTGRWKVYAATSSQDIVATTVVPCSKKHCA